MRNVIFSSLISNAIYGLVAMLWIYGLQNVVKPLPAALRMQLRGLAILLPFFASLLRGAGWRLFPESWLTIRLDLWLQTLLHAGIVFQILLAGLLIGTMLIVFIQEWIPFLKAIRSRHGESGLPDPALERILQETLGLFRAAGIRIKNPSQLMIRKLPIHFPVAALEGLRRPTIVVSSGLIQSLTDLELRAALAHELAHVYYGGNLRIYFFWVFRLLQSFSPATMVLFRSLVETREDACDEMAAYVIGNPSILASAITKGAQENLVIPESQGGTTGVFEKAQNELLRRAETVSVEHRLLRLKAFEPGTYPTGWHVWIKGLDWIAALILGGILCTVF